MLAAAVALAWRRPLVFATVAVSVWAADLAAVGLKQLVDRPRPFTTIAADHVLGGHPGSSSMPSGHATTAFAGAVALGYVVRRAAPLLLALAAAIAYSRVYLGVHYPFDVVAGAALGASVAVAVLALVTRPLHLAESLRPRRAARPPG